MFVPDPAWISATAEIAVAAETGVSMLGKSGKKTTEEAVPAATGGVAVPAVGLDALMVFAGLVLLGMAVLASALILHHGLTA